MVVNQQLRESRLAARSALERAGTLGFKPVSSAKWVDVERKWSGKLHVRIEHDIIRHCSPEMIQWWFENLGGKTRWDGKDFEGPEISFYHLWHHRDHIAIIPTERSGNGFRKGATTKLAEQFNDFHESIDIVVTTDRLDSEEFTFTAKVFGLSVCRVIHYYSQVPGGSRFYAETVIGSDLPILGIFLNWLIIPFIYSKSTAENWIRHNIEETGRSEDIIPILFQHDSTMKASSKLQHSQ
ncbi:hypothetical protein IQ07DRAFT_595725 [Pyrenochaeta sp. DS3sAY3a]|nr:hypothetical protein IQ07DRAFT_595725 [Pyrenochaeta sp. DS3sAY3a]